ncbi:MULTISPECIES: hypothetical protein [Shewanella]|uniref:DUF3592 domain-containing protein n=1 Tax=Shewanella japonica TaxID=93973 RepID=A0ABN4YQ40_9GAMM|nr:MULTISPECIES: hypothetical protein [Shewanella]ARD22977.1 hypothetical protein SJ2017_2690 [Shewanella japonica]KPZ66868.1 hypothetical protein AN944_04215 [Shewanella sp. P1-14-1]
MKTVNFKFALDATIATLFITLGVIYILVVRADKNIESVDLTNSDLSCKVSARGKLRGYFTLDGKEYFSPGTYATCEEFLNRMTEKEIKGKHQKNKSLLVELRVGKSLYAENSVGMRVLIGIFIGLVCFAFLRSPIHWIAKKVI